jgi:hypothetical protein
MVKALLLAEAHEEEARRVEQALRTTGAVHETSAADENDCVPRRQLILTLAPRMTTRNVLDRDAHMI